MNDFQPLWALLREHGSSAKRRIEAGDRRRRTVIFKEVYASLKAQLQRERTGSGTGAERGQVLTK